MPPAAAAGAAPLGIRQPEALRSARGAILKLNMVLLFSWVTYLGNWEVVAVASVAVLLFLASRREWRYLRSFVFVLGASEATVYALKQFIARPRPLDPLILVDDPYSFPSGHSNIGVAFYFSLAYLINKNFVSDPRQRRFVWLGAIVIALLIGASRLVLRVHHIEDVVAGYVIAIFWLSAAYRLFLKKSTR